MAYPAPFHRIVMIGNLYADTFNTTVAMVPTGGGTLPEVSDDLVEDVGLLLQDWWNNTFGGTGNGLGIVTAAALTSVKVNRIGTDGKYMDAETKEHIFSSPVPGVTSNALAPQLSLAVTLRGSNERARAGKGRMYFPPSAAFIGLGSDGRVTAANALDHAKGALFLLGALDDVYSAAGVSAVAGITSSVGAGAFQAVHHVSVGRVVDTMRSRRNKLPEDPQEWGTP